VVIISTSYLKIFNTVFRMILGITSDYSLNSINKLIFLIVKSGVLFDVPTEFLNIT
jgi:hypothetical protein